MPEKPKFEQILTPKQLEAEKARLLGEGHTEEEVEEIFELSRERKKILAEIERLGQTKGVAAAEEIEELREKLDKIIEERKTMERKRIFRERGIESWEKIDLEMVFEKEMEKFSFRGAKLSLDRERITFLKSYGDDKTFMLLNKKGDILAEKNWGDPNASCRYEHPRFSPDGERAALAIMNNLLVYNKNGKLVFEKEFSGDIKELSFSPDSGKLLFRTGDGTLHISDTKGNIILEKEFDKDIRDISFLPNNREILLKQEIDGEDYLQIYSLREKDLVIEMSRRVVGGIFDLDISPNGKMMICRSYEGKGVDIPQHFRLFERIMRHSLLEIKKFKREINRASFSPDGKELLLTEGNIVSTVSLEGEQVFSKKFKKIEHLEFCPDGKGIIVKEDDKTLYFLNRNGDIIFKKIFEDKIEDFRFSPDGKELLVVLEKKGDQWFVTEKSALRIFKIKEK